MCISQSDVHETLLNADVNRAIFNIARHRSRRRLRAVSQSADGYHNVNILG